MTTNDYLLDGACDCVPALYMADRRDWLIAVSMARVRVAANAGRHHSSCNGKEKNLLADVCGCFGEFVFRSVIAQDFGHETAEACMPDVFSFKGGKDQPLWDACVDGLFVDVKACEISPRKKLVIVSKPKHEKNRGTIDAYVFVFFPLGGKYVWLSPLVHYDDVDAWPERTLRPGRPPVKHLAVTSFFEQYGPDKFFNGTFRALCENQSYLSLLVNDGICEAKAGK